MAKGEPLRDWWISGKPCEKITVVNPYHRWWVVADPGEGELYWQFFETFDEAIKEADARARR